LRPQPRANTGTVRAHPELFAEAALRLELPARSAAQIASILFHRRGFRVARYPAQLGVVDPLQVIKNRGHFPTDDAVVKLLWLAICDIEDKRARARQAERGKPATQRTAPARLIEGSVTTGWKQALAALAEFCEDRNLDKII
jgi:hypothetical protein